MLALSSICLRFTVWPVCSMCLLRLPGGMVVSVAALMRVLSVVLVVYHELALEVDAGLTEASCCLP